jgi:hypothetical protein
MSPEKSSGRPATAKQRDRLQSPPRERPSTERFLEGSGAGRTDFSATMPRGGGGGDPHASASFSIGAALGAPLDDDFSSSSSSSSGSERILRELQARIEALELEKQMIVNNPRAEPGAQALFLPPADAPRWLNTC